MKKALCALLSFVLFLNIANASSGLDVWGDRRAVFSGKPAVCPHPTVYLIKDIHANRDAQDEIARRLDQISRASTIDLIALEGAAESLDISTLRQFPYPQSIRAAANYLYGQKKISGVMHWALSKDGIAPPIVGIDDALFYAQNVNAFRKAYMAQPAFASLLSNEQGKLNAEKIKIFNPTLLAFDKKAHTYHGNQISLAEYLSCFVEDTKNERLSSLRSALAIEGKLNYPAIEKERSAFLKAVFSRGSMAGSNLLSLSAAYGLGNVAHGTFYREMIKAGRQSHVLLSSYPALSSYLEYIMLIEKAHIETIGAEVSRLEQEEYAARVINAGEARLVKRSRENYLNIQLANFSLTREEWNEYKASGMHGRDSRRAPFEDFYRLAERRDQTLSKNLLKQMSNHNTVVAVVGGFHASRVQGALQKEGIEVVVINPTVTRVEEGQTFQALTLFARESTPLEKLFLRESVFLPLPPMSPSVAAAQRVLTLAHVEAITPEDLTGKDEKELVKDIGLQGEFEARDVQERTADFTIKTDQGLATGRMKVEKNGEIREVTARILGRHERGNHSVVTVVEGTFQEAIEAYKKKKQSRKRRNRANTLEEAYRTVLPRYPQLIGRRINLRIVDGADQFGQLIDNTIVLDQQLFDNAFLLDRILREELHHLLFRFLSRALWHHEPLIEQLAIEELHTDLSHLAAFSSITDEKKQAGIIAYMLKDSRDTNHFFKYFLKVLSPQRRDEVAAHVERMVSEGEVKKLQSVLRELNMAPAIDISRGLVRAEGELVRVLADFYVKSNIYPELTDVYVSKREVLYDFLISYRSDYSSMLEEYRNRMENPPSLMLGDVPFYTDPHFIGSIMSKDVVSQDLMDMETIVGNKDVVVVEPHPDDAAISMGLVMSRLRQIAKNVNLISSVPDHLGVPDRYIDDHYSPKNEHDRGVLKEYVREQETATFAASVLTTPATVFYKNLKIQLPLVKPVHKTDDRGTHFVGYLSEWEDFSGPTGSRYVESVRRTVQAHKNAPVWFLPFPFTERPHHPHHVAISLQFLKELRAENYSGTVIFYETFEAETDFDSAHIVPNVVYTFGENEISEKAYLINIFESQTYRRDYAQLSADRDRRNFVREQARRERHGEDHRYAERYVVGRLTEMPAVNNGFGRWPWLRPFYEKFGDGFVGAIALPVLIESILPSLMLKTMGVTSLGAFVAYQILWQALHGRGALSSGKTATTLVSVAALAASFYGAQPSLYSILSAYAIPHVVLNVFHLSRFEVRLANDLVEEMVDRANGRMNARRSERLAKGLSQAFPLGFELGRFYSTDPRMFDRAAFHAALNKKLRQNNLERVSVERALSKNIDRDVIVVPIYDSLPVVELKAMLNALGGMYDSRRAVAFVGETTSHELNVLVDEFVSRSPRYVRFQAVGLIVQNETGEYTLDLRVAQRVLGGLLEGATGVQFLIGGVLDVRSDGLAQDSLLLRAVFSLLSEDLKMISVGIGQLNAMKDIAQLVGRQA